MAARSARIVVAPTLSEATIVDAARELARKQGFAKVSMRSLAARLGVSATALYYHFKNKNELFEGVAASIFEQIAIVNPTLPWAEQLRTFVLNYQACLLDYPGLARVILANRDGRAGMLWTETILSILKRGGFKDDAIWPALGTLVFFINPMTLFDEKPHAARAALYDRKLLKRAVAQSPSTFPMLQRLLNDPRGNVPAVQLSYSALLPLALDRIIAQLELELRS